MKTSFVTNLGDGSIVAQTAPDLMRAVNATMDDKKRELPKYEYPSHVVTAAMLQKYCAHEIGFVIPKGECMIVNALDDQKNEGKGIYGGGLLVSDKIAMERLAAERLERLAAERLAQKQKTIWKLSGRELEIIKGLSSKK